METERFDDETKTSTYFRTILFVLMAIFGPVFAYVVNDNAEEKAKLEALHYQEERAEVTLTKIRAFLLNATQLAETLRVLTEQYYGTDLTQIETYLDRIVESAPEDLIYGAGVWYEPFRFRPQNRYVGPYVHRGSRSGQRILTKEWENPSYDFHKRDWYVNAIQNHGSPTFTEPYFDNGQVFMTLAISFNDRKSGSIRGVVSVDMILPQLQTLVDSVNENSTDVISIIGKGGRLLAHPKSTQLLEEARRESGEGASVRSVLDIPESFYKKKPWTTIESELPMRENGWTVHVSSPKASVMAGYLSQKTLIIALTIFFEVALLIIYLLVGFFDEGMSRLKERSYQAVMAERNQIKAIVDNVQFGLLRADRRGRIQSGYSQSCKDLLGIDKSSDMTRRVFWHYFGLSRREEDNFESFYEQVFELPFLASEMVDQIPSQVTVRGKILSCKYYPIMKGELVESVLVTFADVSRSRSTAQENEGNKALLRILKNRERFTALASEILLSDIHLLSTSAWPNLKTPEALRKIKSLIHTWKGDLATFGLEELVLSIHTIEDSLRPNLSLTQSQAFMSLIQNQLETFLERHHTLLQIQKTSVEERQIVLSEKTVLKIRDELLAAESLAEVQKKVLRFVDESTQIRVENTLSYLAIAAQNLAARQDKDVEIDLRGVGLSVPKIFEPVFSSLIHLVRNAIDHGLEKPRERGKKGPSGHLQIAVLDFKDHCTIKISDDGRGIDREKLKQQVMEKGLIREEAWDLLDLGEQLLFVFEESISTQTEVTLVSGRGVGLDKVKAVVSEVSGTIHLTSHAGQGTTFEIVLLKPRASA